VLLRDTAEDRVAEFSLIGVRQARAAISQVRSVGLNLATQLHFDLAIQKLLFFPTLQPEELTQSLNQLRTYQISNPFVQSLYVVNNRTDRAYISSDRTFEMILTKKQLFARDPSLRAVLDGSTGDSLGRPVARAVSGPAGTSHVYSFVYGEIGLKNASSQSVVVVNLSQIWLQELIAAAAVAPDEVVIADNDGSVMSNSSRFEMNQNISDLGLLQKASMADGSDGYFRHDLKGDPYLVAFSHHSATDWYAFLLVSQARIAQEFARVQRTVVSVALALLGAGLLTAFLVSGRIYRPYLRMQQRVRALENDRHKYDLAAGRQLLRDLLQESGRLGDDEVQRSFDRCGIAMSASEPILPVLILIDDSPRFWEEAGPPNRESAKHELVDLAMLTLVADGRGHTLTIGTDRAVVLKNVRGDFQPQDQDSFLADIALLQSKVSDAMDVSISVSIGPVAPHAVSLSNAFSRTLDAAGRRLALGRGCIVFADEHASATDSDYRYPVKKETLLISALRGEEFGRAEEIAEEIVSDAAPHSSAAISLSIARLVFTIRSELAKKLDQYAGESVGSPLPALPSLGRFEVAEEVLQPLFDTMRGLEQRIADHRSRKSEEVTRNVRAIVHKHFANQQLCLDLIAKKLGLTPTYIGRVFKRETGSTILHYIVNVRMMRAEERLRTSDLTVGELAAATGFSSPSYFHRVFKRHFGVTPSEYRSEHRSNPESR
jgi:AraC-like DNA-binding protein